MQGTAPGAPHVIIMARSFASRRRLQCAANPVPILLGFLCQYTILPILAVVSGS